MKTFLPEFTPGNSFLQDWSLKDCFKKFLRILIFAIIFFIGSCEAKSETGYLPYLYLLLGQPAQIEKDYLFTRPDLSSSHPERKKAHSMVIQEIEKATDRIDLFVYGLNEPELIQALVAAKRRGVALHLTGSRDQTYTEAKNAGLNINLRTRSGLQHVKFILVDHTKMISGTGNFTTTGFFHNNNLFFKANLSTDKATRISHSLFHEEEAEILMDLHSDFSALLSPGHGKLIQSEIIQQILQAQTEIQIMMFSVTDPLILSALAIAIRKGVIVELILDDSGESGTLTSGSRIEKLNSSLGLFPSTVYLDGNRSGFKAEDGFYHGGKMHQKTMIVDRKTVLTGSYNWSMSARNSNMEIFYKIESPAIAMHFSREFERAKQASLPVARPPTPPRLESEFQIVNSRTVCLNRQAGPLPDEQGELAFFAGRGPFFQGILLKVRSQNCYDLMTDPDDTAGIATSSTHFYSSYVDENNLPFHGILDYNFHVFGTSLRKEVCSANCSAPQAVFHDPESGILWMPPSEPPLREIQVWHRNGLSEWTLLNPVDPGLYHYTSPCPDGCADAIISFRLEKALHNGDPFTTPPDGYLCRKDGSSLSPPVQHFLDALQWKSVQDSHVPIRVLCTDE